MRVGRLEAIADILAIMQIGGRMNLHNRDSEVTDLLIEIKQEYDKL